MMRTIFLCAALALAACQPAARGYPPQYEMNFMRSCQSAGSAVSVCSCIWERIEAEVPVSEFTAAEQALGAGQTHPLTQRLVEFGNTCRSAPATTTSAG